MSTVLDGQYLTVSEAADELGLSRQRVHKLIVSGQLESEAIHERLLVIPRKSLDAFKKLDRPSGLHIDQRKPATTANRRRKTG
jgi:excisionase family DNA binding protein